MRLAFHYRPPVSKQCVLLNALEQGLAKAGDRLVVVEGFAEVLDVDGLAAYGIGGHTRHIFDAYRGAGKRVLFLDKGYVRGRGLFRVAVDDFQPLRHLWRQRRAAARWEALGLRLQNYRGGGTHILLDGASNKYCVWQGLGDWVQWGAAMVQRIREHTDRPIIYRPRPSHNGAHEVSGAELSQGPLEDDLRRARVVVSYGGNIGFDAVLAGIPHFAIGDSIARELSETNWRHVDRPYVPMDATRRQFVQNVAWWQWTLPEIASGEMWRNTRGYLT